MAWTLLENGQHKNSSSDNIVVTEVTRDKKA